MKEWVLKILKKAEKNVAKWGSQDISVLLLCLTEELGELTQAYLEHTNEGETFKRIEKELVDLMALGFQLKLELKGFEK